MTDTDPLLPLFHDVWREVSRHLEIGPSVQSLFLRIAQELPARWMMIRRWDAARGRIETVASAGSLPPALPQRLIVPTPKGAELERWGSRGRIRIWLEREQEGLGRVIVPEGAGGAVVAGPLLEPEESALDPEGRRPLRGFLLLGGAEGPWMDAVQDLCRPLAVALANDGRLHELNRLREAAEAENRALRNRLSRADISDTIVGAEGGLRPVMQRVEQVARTDVPVLIFGETGSGKEVVARAVHDRSPRADAPFLRVNCGAIPPELVDSELFGHEKGSFTGAVATRRGWFERADGGTLFLDELGELPAAAQVRLLRVLQDGSFTRVGGQEMLSVDVRIVAATHRDIHTMVRDGRFRQDLWYRVSVFPITLPPLRERPDDLPALASHFAERAGVRLYGVPLHPSPADVDTLLAYDWPGNVRELAAVIERAAILGDGKGLAMTGALGVSPAAHAPLNDDRAQIEAALARCRGRIEGPFGAAAALGVNPHTLRSRMRKFGIEWSRYRSG